MSYKIRVQSAWIAGLLSVSLTRSLVKEPHSSIQIYISPPLRPKKFQDVTVRFLENADFYEKVPSVSQQVFDKQAKNDSEVKKLWKNHDFIFSFYIIMQYFYEVSYHHKWYYRHYFRCRKMDLLFFFFFLPFFLFQ